MFLNVATNVFADLHIFCYWTSQESVESLNILSYSCGNRTVRSVKGQQMDSDWKYPGVFPANAATLLMLKFCRALCE